MPIFKVAVEVEFYMEAEDLDGAYFDADEMAQQALRDGGPGSVSAYQVTDPAKVPAKWLDALPYGGDLTATIRDILAAPPPEAPDPRIFWSFSSDEEHFMGDFDTREEAIAAAPVELGLRPGDSFWVGMGSHYTVDDVDVDNLFERMAEQAVEECGEVAEDWGPVPDEECEREIHAAVLRCLTRQKDAPGFWMVGEISKHTTPDDAKEPA